MAQKQVSCDCGRVIREQTDALNCEGSAAAKEVHDMDLSPEQVLSMAEPA